MARDSKRSKGNQKKSAKMAMATDIYNRTIDLARKDIIAKFIEQAKFNKGGSADLLPADQGKKEIIGARKTTRLNYQIPCAQGETETGIDPILLVLVVFRGYCQLTCLNPLILVALEGVQWIGKLRFCH